MIDELQVYNIALIREATLVPSAGLTVLTGETGAGKTALLSALKLILGERADSSTVREGEALASVEARLFDGPHDTEGFTVQRSLSAEGRSRVKIDGRIASVRELSERVGVMMDLCGQHEHQRLLDPAHHVAMVDAWAGRSALEALEHYRACFKASRAAAKEVASRRPHVRGGVASRKRALRSSASARSTPNRASMRNSRNCCRAPNMPRYWLPQLTMPMHRLPPKGERSTP